MTSTSIGPWYPAWSTRPRSRGRSMAPVAHHAPAGQQVRSSGRASRRRGSRGSAAGALDLALEVRVPPHVVGVDDHADRAGSKRSAIEFAWPSVTTTERSTTIIGCSGSIASDHAVIRRVRHQPLNAREHLVAGASEVAAPRAAANKHQHVGSELRRLLNRAPVVGVATRRSASLAAGKKPPRQRLDPAQAGARIRSAEPGSSLCRHGPIHPMPALAQPSTTSSRVSWSAVIWLKLRRSGSGPPSFTLDPPPPAPAPGGTGARQARIDEHAGAVGEPEDLGEVGDRARALCRPASGSGADDRSGRRGRRRPPCSDRWARRTSGARGARSARTARS